MHLLVITWFEVLNVFKATNVVKSIFYDEMNF